ncbi:MAG: class I mannose-6-phosphate isomerase [Deltaproteobacteria bacterium]|nr:class I mannose-6-phosphate isomerase [Deltaproteobacteria bacterium]
MAFPQLYPIRLSPVFKKKIWGKSDYSALYGNQVGGLEQVGEIWCNHDAPEGSTITNGSLEGRPFVQVMETLGEKLVGATWKFGRFPLILKFINTSQDLSIQVHPSDSYAQKVENIPWGKTEAWFILEAEPGSRVLLGFKESQTRAGIEQALQEGRIHELVDSIPVKRGDVIFVPEGTIHAVGQGILLFEVQNNCDITYRLYDWERCDTYGRPRELHIDRGMDVLNLKPLSQTKVPRINLPFEGGAKDLLVACQRFVMERICTHLPYREELTGETFVALTGINGVGRILTKNDDGGIADIAPGITVIIPAGLSEFTLEPENGQVDCLKTYITNSMDGFRRLLMADGVPEWRLSNGAGPLIFSTDG